MVDHGNVADCRYHLGVGAADGLSGRVGTAGRLVAGVEGKGVNRDDIFRLAESFNTLRTEWVFNKVKLQQFFWAAYRAGVAAEREACAKLCEEFDCENPYIGQARAVAFEIRQRNCK